MDKQIKWIQDTYHVENSFPFVVGTLYYTRLKKGEGEALGDDRFLHELNLQTTPLKVAETEAIDQLKKQNEDIFTPVEKRFVDQNHLYQVFEPLKGDLLAHKMKNDKSLQLADMLEISISAIKHLLQLYQEDQFTIVHPQNMLVLANDQIRFLYGGLLEVLPQGILFNQEKETIKRFDSYSLGVMLYKMVTGNHPMEKGLKVKSLTEFLPDFPSELDQLVNNSLSFDMNKRPSIEQYNEVLSKLQSKVK